MNRLLNRGSNCGEGSAQPHRQWEAGLVNLLPLTNRKAEVKKLSDHSIRRAKTGRNTRISEACLPS